MKLNLGGASVDRRFMRAFLAAGFAVILQIAAADARADFITGIATIQADNPKNGGVVGLVQNVDNVNLQGKDDRSFTNTYGVDQSGAALIRVVGVAFLQSYDLYPTGSFNPINFNGSQAAVVAVFALDGKVISTSGTNSTALFTSGTEQLFRVDPQSTFSPTDPSTWGAVANLSAGTLNSAIATFALKPQENVYEGLNNQAIPQGGLIMAAANVNTSTISTGSGNQTSGNLLFKETTPPDPITYLTVTSPPPPGVTVDAQGFFAQFNQSINTADTKQVGATNLQYLNLLAAKIGGYSDLGAAGSGTAFATGLGSANLTDYAGNANVGDFVAGFDSATSTQGELQGNRPGLEFEAAHAPEPSSLALLCAGAAGLVAARRRKRLEGR